jgi:hypothetical protein
MTVTHAGFSLHWITRQRGENGVMESSLVILSEAKDYVICLYGQKCRDPSRQKVPLRMTRR